MFVVKLKKMKFFQFLFFVFILFLVSCTSNKNIVYLRGTQDEIFNVNNDLSYKLQQKDLLYIRIVSNNEVINKMYNYTYSETAPSVSESYLYLYGYLVNDSGYVTLPNIGNVFVAGCTISEAKKRIEIEAAKYLQEFAVFVKLAYFKISILGEVKSPGLFSVFQDKYFSCYFVSWRY